MRQKRFLSWLLTLCLLLGMFSFPAYAEGNTTTNTISGDGTADKTGTMTVTLVIPKKTPTATDLTYTAPSDLTYSGSNKTATVAAASGVTGLGTITVKYYSDASRSTEVTETKNVGTYYVGATVAEGDQYAASTAVLYGDGWTFTITASTPDAPAAPTKASATKNSITLNEVSGCECSKDGANWQNGTEFTGLLPGTEYTFYQRVKATANTNASAASSAKFSTEADTYAMTITLVIKPAQTITATDVTATYGDTDKSVSASITEPTTGGGAISYAVKEGSGDYIDVAADGKLTIKAVPPTDGKAYVIVTVAETDDYAEATKEVVVTISKATVTVAAENQSIYVNGTVPDLSSPVLDTHYTVTGLVGEETLTTAPTLAYQKNGEAATPDSATAGTYDIVASGAAASDNYSISYTNGTLTISNKGTQTISAENVTATYGDTDKSVSATVTDPATGGGDISYAVKEGSGDYIEINASTGALTIKAVPADGKAYVIVTAAETGTYTQATKEVTVTINKANAVAATVTANNRTYDGTEKPLVTVTGTPTGGEMQYALGTATEATQPYTTSIPTATEAGTYHVWYKAVGDDTHNDSTPVRVDVTINKADSEPKEVNANNWIYDGTPHELVTINQPLLQQKITLLKTVSSLVPYNILINEEKAATDDKEAIDTIEESKSEEQKVEEAKSEDVVENQDTSDESKVETKDVQPTERQLESQEALDETASNEQVENIESENSDQNNSGLSEEIIIQNSLVLDDALTTTDSDVDTESVQKDDNNSEETNDQEGDKTVSVEETNDDEVETENTDTEVVDSTDKSTEETQQEDTSVKEENKEEAQQESKVVAEEKSNVTRNRMLNSVRLLQLGQEAQEEGPVLKFVVSDNNESAPSEGWSSEIPLRENAGTYYVWYKVFGDSNHKDSEAAYVTVTVSKATATIKVKDKTIYVGDTVPALDGSDCYTVTGLCGEDTLTAVPTLAYQKSGEVVSPDSSKAGEYDIVASGADAGDNYNISYEKGKLTISETAKADADIVPSEDAPSILPTKPEISNELAEQAAKIAEADGSKVELKLTVKADEESKVSESTVLNQKPQMKLQVQSQFKDEDTVKVDVVDIDIKQIINGSDKGTLTETNSVLEIGIGYDFTGKYDPVVVREHNGTSQAFRALEARPSSGNYVDGTFFADTANNKLYIYSRLFSQYVIAYSTVEGNAQNRVASTTSSSSSKTPEVSTVPVYRLFNAKIGYHFFTANVAEKNALVAAGWTDEGIAWQVQPKAGKSVYRLFDKTRGMHVFTADATEKATLIAAGAVDEGIAWYGHEAGRTVYKVTNPKVNKVLYTTSVAEKDALAATGFTVEEANFKVN